MPYKTERFPEIGTLISYITPHNATDEEMQEFMGRVVQTADDFAALGVTHIYHILVVEPRDFNFVTGMRSIRTIQQNKDLADMRKRMNVMTILVGQTPKPFQILITLLSSSSFGGRKMAIFPTLEPALAFVRTDYATHSTPPTPETKHIDVVEADAEGRGPQL